MVKRSTSFEIPHELSQTCTQMSSMCSRISPIENLCISFCPDTWMIRKAYFYIKTHFWYKMWREFTFTWVICYVNTYNKSKYCLRTSGYSFCIFIHTVCTYTTFAVSYSPDKSQILVNGRTDYEINFNVSQKTVVASYCWDISPYDQANQGESKKKRIYFCTERVHTKAVRVIIYIYIYIYYCTIPLTQRLHRNGETRKQTKTQRRRTWKETIQWNI